MSKPSEKDPLINNRTRRSAQYQLISAASTNEQVSPGSTDSEVQEASALMQTPVFLQNLSKIQWTGDGIDKMKEKIKQLKEVTVMIVGRSGVGKSTLLNSLFQVDDEKAAEQGFGAGPQTTQCTTFSMKIDELVLHVIDTPGYYKVNDTDKAASENFFKTIKENCERADIILMCFQMDSNAGIDDSGPIALITRSFNDEFWKRTIFVLTRANQVKPVGKHSRDHSKEEYFKLVLVKKMDEIKSKLTDAKAKVDIDSIQFAIAGSPGPYEKKACDTDIDSNNGLDVDTPHGVYVLQDLTRYDDPEKWVNLFVIQCLASHCSDKGKLALLKIHTNWKLWAGGTATASAGSVALLGGGIALCCGGAGAGVIPFVGIPLAATLCTLGGVAIALSLGGVGGTAALGRKAHIERKKEDAHF